MFYYYMYYIILLYYIPSWRRQGEIYLVIVDLLQ
jgi:hypothetical protein